MISDQLRTKQGPLARVWLASHWERKLSKSQFLQTNLEKTIETIQHNQEEEPIALRVSGQLLLGVVRIYSRKTRYLLEDCNEALVKIKLAFKKGDVNMPDIHHSVANVNTITLQDKLTEFDILLPDLPFNSGNHLNDERDPILDSLGDMSTQDITMNDTQNGFSFGNWEIERGLGQDGIEVGRRDNEAGFADNSFDMDAIADPLKDMNISDNNNGLGIDDIAFDFDVNDEIDYNDDNIYNEDFDLQQTSNNNDSLDTLMQVGIVGIDDADNEMFNIDGMDTEPAVRRRRKLVVDENTEIPQADLRRYISDTSSIISKNANASGASKPKTSIELAKPTGGELGSELDSLFSRMNSKRRAPAIMSEVQKQARFDDGFGAPTPGAAMDESAFQFEDYGDDDAGGFDETAYNNYDNTMDEQRSNDYDALMAQNTQTFSNNTRETLETIENKLTTQSNVKFGELASASTRKADAAKLFYDVLLLSTKNKIKVKQDRAFGEIQISAPTLAF